MKLPLRFLASLALAVPFCIAQAPPASANAADAGAAPPAHQEAAPPSGSLEATSPKPSKPYVIGPLDVLDIRVWNDPKLTNIYAVRPDGQISMPLVGEIKADGLTVPELAKTIAEKLTAVMVDPEVNIQLGRMNSKKYSVLGEVARPGEFPLTGEIHVLDAFASTGGFKDFANLKGIYILRGSERLKFNYKDVSHGKHMEQNVLLQNGDKIFVPE